MRRRTNPCGQESKLVEKTDAAAFGMSKRRTNGGRSAYAVTIDDEEGRLPNMVEVKPIDIDGRTYIGITVELPKTTLLAVTTDKGYIMCGALDIGLLNERLKDRRIVAGRAVGVRSIEQLLEAPLESVTYEAEALGITPGMKGRDALRKM
jgi:uncharacterized protein YunC (DUF1805 family)